MYVGKVLRTLEEIERKLELLYLGYSALFSEDIDAKNLFSQLSRDEGRHREIISLQIKLLSSSDNKFKEVDIAWDWINQTLNLIDLLMNPETPPTLQEVIHHAISIESSAAEHYYKGALIQANPAIKKLVGNLARENDLHFKSLLDFAERRGFKK